MRDLKGVVERWRREHTGTAWGELDIEEMFPNIARDEVEPAVNFFLTQMAGKVPNHGHAFVIHKGGLLHLDSFGAKTRDSAYCKISYTDIQQYLFFETRFDEFFSSHVLCVPPALRCGDRGSLLRTGRIPGADAQRATAVVPPSAAYPPLQGQLPRAVSRAPGAREFPGGFCAGSGIACEPLAHVW